MEGIAKKWDVIGLENWIIVNAGPDRNWSTCGHVAHKLLFAGLGNQELRDKVNACQASGRFALAVDFDQGWDVFGGFASLADCLEYGESMEIPAS